MPRFVATPRADLDGTGWSSALEHGDLQGNNVLSGAGRYWIFDWADASVGLPLTTLLVVCDLEARGDLDSPTGRRVSRRLRDAYLEGWSAIEQPALLRARFGPAMWVANVSRALDWEHMLPEADGPGVAEWRPHVAQWLCRFADRADWATSRDWP